RGANYVHFDVDNLFFSLPCSFRLKDSNNELADEVFTWNQPFTQRDESPYGKARSQPEWIEHIQRSTRVFRVDYATDDGKYWGTFDLGDPAEELGRPVGERQRELEVSFEITSELDLALRFRRKKTASRRFPGYAQAIDLGTELARILEAGEDAPSGDRSGSAGASPSRGGLEGGGDGRSDGLAPVDAKGDPGKELGWGVAVRVSERGHHKVFPARTAFD